MLGGSRFYGRETISRPPSISAVFRRSFSTSANALRTRRFKLLAVAWRVRRWLAMVGNCSMRHGPHFGIRLTSSPRGSAQPLNPFCRFLEAAARRFSHRVGPLGVERSVHLPEHLRRSTACRGCPDVIEPAVECCIPQTHLPLRALSI